MSSPRNCTTASVRCRRWRRTCVRIAKLKLGARAIGVRRLDLGPQGGSVVFEERAAIEPATLVRMIQKAPREYRLEGPLKVRIARALPSRGRPLRVRPGTAQAPRAKPRRSIRMTP